MVAKDVGHSPLGDPRRPLRGFPVRCTNSVSLYMYLFINVVVWLTVTKTVRWLMGTLVPAERTLDGLNFVRDHRNRIQFIVISMTTIGLVSLVFMFLSLWFPFFKKPHTLLIMAINVHMMANSFVDGFFPNIPTTTL